jgi:hypothetical protein
VNPMLRTEEWQYEYTLQVPDSPPPLPTEIEGVEIEGEPLPPAEYQSPPMISQLVVSVWYHEDDESERIWIQQDGGIVSELGLDTKDAVEHVPEGQMRFVWAFPYDIVKAALESKGWTHASTTEA